MQTIKEELIKRNLVPVYFTKPNYNLNSRIRSKQDVIDKLLDSKKINFIDVGCRGNAAGELKYLCRHINLIGFDADSSEIERLSKDEKKISQFNSLRFYHYCLDSEAGEKTLYITKEGGTSSFYKLNSWCEDYYSVEQCEIVEEVSLQTERLDTVVNKEGMNSVDGIKVDTQGSELNILKGGEQILRDLLLIETEVGFWEIYKNQPLFADVDAFLRKNDFNLLYLNRVFAKGKMGGERVKYMYSKGSLLFGDALYAKKIEATEKMSVDKVIKFIVILCNYGHYDYAMGIFKFNEARLPEESKVLLNQLFCCNSNKFVYQISAILAAMVDWIIFWLLQWRRWNHFRWDSDRSYPIR